MPRKPGAPKPDPIIVADHVTRRFGGMTAVDVHHLEVQRGAITALIGPNGAGKTTLFNLLTGFDKPNSGEWSFNGEEVSRMSAAQGRPLRAWSAPSSSPRRCPRMTVLENMRLGATDQSGEGLLRSLFPPLWRAREAEITAQADELLARFKLDTKAADFAGSLSGGQRKLLEMARALMAKPTMVMLDEPMAGVNPALTQSLLGPHPGPARRGHDGAVRRARHAHGPAHLRLGRGHGRGPGGRRGAAHHDHAGRGRGRRLPRRAPRDRPGRRLAARRRGAWTSSRPRPRPRSTGRRRTHDHRDHRRRGPPRCAGRRTAARGQGPVRRLPAGRGHPQRLQPRAPPRRAGRHHRPQRRRQVDPAQGAVRPRADPRPAR